MRAPMRAVSSISTASVLNFARIDLDIGTTQAAGIVSTVAGSGLKSLHDGPVATASFERPRSLSVDIKGRAVIADMNESNEALLRVVDLNCGVVTTLQLVSPMGDPVTLPASRITIGGAGDIIAVNAVGVFLIAGAGLAPGFHPWSQNRWTPTSACCSDSPPWATASVWVVLLVAARSFYSSPQPPSGRGNLAKLPVLPIELWYHTMGMLQTWELGRLCLAPLAEPGPKFRRRK